MHFTLKDIVAHFDEPTLRRAENYARLGNVVGSSRIGDYIQGTVHGSGRNVYHQDIALFADGARVSFEGECSCPVGYDCKHVAAVLIASLQAKVTADSLPASAQRIPTVVAAWLQRVESAVLAADPAPGATAPKSAKTTHRLIFVLVPAPGGKKISLSLCKARLRVNGEIAAAAPVYDALRLLSNPPDYIQQQDDDLIRLLVAMRGGIYYSDTYSELKGKIGAQLLRLLLEENKLWWANSSDAMAKGLLHPLKAAPARRADLAWREENDDLRLAWQFQPAADDMPDVNAASKLIDHVLPTDPPWYLDNLSCGELHLPLGDRALSPSALQELVAQAPPLAPADKKAVSQLLLARGLHRILPLPEQLPETIRDDIAVEPLLLLGSAAQFPAAGSGEPVWHDFGVLRFGYDGETVTLDPTLKLVRQSAHGIETIVRDQAAELRACQTLSALGFSPPTDAGSPLNNLTGALLLPTQSDWLRFAREDLPGLIAQGWRVEKTPDYRYDVAEVEDWYADVDEEASQPGNPWFDLELGIVVNQARVSLLPVLVTLIRSAPHDFNPGALAAHADSDELLATLPDGVRVALPWGRIKPILATLGELYFTDKIGGSLRLSALDAARLAELAGSTQLRWLGGERLRSIGQKLSEFGGVQKVAPPRGLQATLRDYQGEGLAWMQFLREYELAGILADDMGLGKTIQTLAHILIEKEAGRLTEPALVVAPTSLMSNWQDEAARFAPGLRVLLLQGKERLERFEQIGEVDLVLTTYALLPRDEDQLREHSYHLVILDESHYIKNARSKAAQTAGLLRARHRLCLTGTPLENHLGELWSQFHFLLPGLLGDEKAFNNEFRHPIEKQGNDIRRALLSRRIKPFLLRRTKDKVAKELPPKTEMVRSVELSGAQRDLYETVRLAMDKKVRSEIAKKGVARSQIVILEALLKLRQVCCDPRLVKSAAAKKAAAPSAKLVELLEMIEELLEEDRKILVFSQFTSMLALIEDELNARQLGYALLTGDTEDRAGAVRAFQQGEVPLFLISLKAGGVGLNLTAADTVIHYDPWWNPAAENQATDRAWRIGQDKPVFVYKLIAKGTLEEKIQALQQKKADLAHAMLADGGTQNVQITPDDLQAIFAPLEG